MLNKVLSVKGIFIKNVLVIGSRNKFGPNLPSFIYDTSFNFSLTQESCVPFVLIKPVKDGHNWEKVKDVLTLEDGQNFFLAL